jgi:hypothetical protein
MSTRIFLGPVRMADNLPPSSADVMKSGSLNLCGPHRPVIRLLYLVPLTGGVIKGCVFRISTTSNTSIAVRVRVYIVME